MNDFTFTAKGFSDYLHWQNTILTSCRTLELYHVGDITRIKNFFLKRNKRISLIQIKILIL